MGFGRAYSREFVKLCVTFHDEEFQSWLEEQKNFREHIQTVCQKHGKLVKNVKIQVTDLLYDNETKLLLCGNGKVFFQSNEFLNLLIT